jgi:ABC-2 type transport system permease protein
VIQDMRAEFLKLKTVRSTYILTAILLLLLGFISFWAVGYRSFDRSSHYFEDSIGTIAPLTSIIGGIIAILLMAHEYRYNTIVYSLTASKSRSKVLAAKFLVIFVFVFLLAILVTIISILLSILGNNLAGHPLPPQQINWASYFAKEIFYCTGYALVGLMVTALIRNLVFSIVFLLIAPNTIESLLNLLLKEKSVYLPFTALSQVIAGPPPLNENDGPFKLGHLSPLKGALVFGIYFVIGWITTWYLFLRRDAS